VAITVILWIDNLFSRAQLQQKLVHGVSDVQATSSGEEAFSILRENPQAIAFIDAENHSLPSNFWEIVKPFAQRVVLYYPHVRTEIVHQAKGAGIRHVYPRSQVFKNPGGILERLQEEKAE